MLAVYITRILTPQNEKDKQEKILLIEYIKNFQTQLHAKSNAIIGCESFNSSLFNNHFKVLRQKLHSSLSLAEKRNFISNDDEISTNLKQAVTNILEILTDESHYNIDGIKIESKTIVESHIIKTDELVFEIISTINKK